AAMLPCGAASARRRAASLSAVEASRASTSLSSSARRSASSARSSASSGWSATAATALTSASELALEFQHARGHRLGVDLVAAVGDRRAQRIHLGHVQAGGAVAQFARHHLQALGLAGKADALGGRDGSAAVGAGAAGPRQWPSAGLLGPQDWPAAVDLVGHGSLL